MSLLFEQKDGIKVVKLFIMYNTKCLSSENNKSSPVTVTLIKVCNVTDKHKPGSLGNRLPVDSLSTGACLYSREQASRAQDSKRKKKKTLLMRTKTVPRISEKRMSEMLVGTSAAEIPVRQKDRLSTNNILSDFVIYHTSL